MPRLTEVLMYKKPLKKFTNYKNVHVYKQVYPAILKNHVAEKGDRRKVSPCLQEMSQMLVCLKENDYNEGLCSKEVKMFEQCFTEYQTAKRKNTLSSTDEKIQQTMGRINGKQLNNLLQKYPQSNPK